MGDKFSRRRDYVIELAVLGLLKFQRFCPARDGDRVDTAVKLQQALLLLFERALRLDARLNPEIKRQQDEKNNRVENCGPRAHAKNLLRTNTVIAIRNRIAGSTTEPRISTWRAS